MTYYLSLTFYIAICLVSCAYIIRQYRKAKPAQRPQIVMAGIGARAVVLFVVLLVTAR